MKKKREKKVRVWKIRGEGKGEEGGGEVRGEHPKPQPLNPLLLRRILSYPLSPQLLNQQEGSQVKH